MSEQDKVAELLTEIRDILLERDNKYEKYLTDANQVYEQQLNKSRRQGMVHHAVQWGALFFVVYFAVSLALQYSK